MISKRIILTTASILTLGVVGGAAAMATTPTPKTGADTSPLVTQVDNHEARIKNLEGNVSVLQTKTGTAPASTNVPVPTVTQTSPTMQTTSMTSSAAPADSITTQAAPVPTVTAYREIVIDADTSDCEYTYSDGSTYQFHWKTSNPQGAWIEDSQGQNGHWVKATNTNGFCDKRAIGQLKS